MRLFFVILFCLFCVNIFAQRDVTTFLGVPIDGAKDELLEKLKDKGWLPSMKGSDVLHGQFEKIDLELRVVTYNDTVYRIVLSDRSTFDEKEIITRYNMLCDYFLESHRYSGNASQKLSETMDLTYEMKTMNRHIDAVFYQMPDMTTDTYNNITAHFQSSYSEKKRQQAFARLKDASEDESLLEELLTGKDADLYNEIYQVFLKIGTMKMVWFTIDRDVFGRYKILVFFDNKYNAPDIY